MSYNNPIPVAATMIFNSDFSKVLVGKRSIEPRVGGDALIGGYTDEGETPEMAIRREVHEEPGRQIDGAVLHYESSAITANNRLLLFFQRPYPRFFLTKFRTVRRCTTFGLLQQKTFWRLRCFFPCINVHWKRHGGIIDPICF